MKRLRLDSFCHRQWNPQYSGGTKMVGTMDDFLTACNERYLALGEGSLISGYAPFCKHLIIPNWIPEILSPVLPLSKEREPFVRTEYRARRDGELPVLTRWIPSEAVTQHPAKFLDIILYSREQIIQETEATGDAQKHPEVYSEDYEWGIISIKAQDTDYELPMLPITMMRNSLGKSEGGSGVVLDRDQYIKSVEYWKQHVTVE